MDNRLRLLVWERDEGLCQHMKGTGKCLAPGQEIHHILPRSAGGKDEESNLQVRCWQCHHTIEIENNKRIMGHHR